MLSAAERSRRRRREGAAGACATSATRSRCTPRSPRPSRPSAASTSSSTTRVRSRSRTLATDMKRYDLMSQVNARGTFLCSKLALPDLLEARQSAHPHPRAAARPRPQVVRPARRLHDGRVRHEPVHARHGRRVPRPQLAVNSLWPITAIDTAAVRFALGGDAMAARSRGREIVADAAYAVLSRPLADARATSSSTRKCCAQKASATSRATRRRQATARCNPTSSSPTRSSNDRRRG